MKKKLLSLLLVLLAAVVLVSAVPTAASADDTDITTPRFVITLDESELDNARTEVKIGNQYLSSNNTDHKVTLDRNTDTAIVMIYPNAGYTFGTDYPTVTAGDDNVAFNRIEDGRLIYNVISFSGDTTIKVTGAATEAEEPEEEEPTYEPASNGNTYIPLEVTGFNKDVVVEAAQSTSGVSTVAGAAPFDGDNNAANWALYEAASGRTGGLPSDRKITENNHFYNLAQYTGNNVLQLYGYGETANGKLEFVHQTGYGMIAFLGAGGNGDAPFEAQITYTDNTTSDTLTAQAPDWYKGDYNGFEDGPFGRIKLRNHEKENAGLMQCTTGPNLYEFTIAADPTRAIKSIDFKYTGSNDGNNPPRLNIMAVSAVIPANTVSITFDANGGSGSMVNVTGYVKDGSYKIPDCGFTYADHTFLGWATTANGTVITSDTITVSANTTLYAQWQENNTNPDEGEGGGTNTPEPPVIPTIVKLDDDCYIIDEENNTVTVNTTADDYDANYKYFVSVLSLEELSLSANESIEYVLNAVNKEVVDAANINVNGFDENTITMLFAAHRLLPSISKITADITYETTNKITEDSVIVIFKVDENNFATLTDSGNTFYAYAVYGIYAEFVDVQETTPPDDEEDEDDREIVPVGGMSGYFTDKNGIMAYSINSYGFDVRGFFGGEWKKTSFGDSYHTYLKAGEDEATRISLQDGGYTVSGLNVSISFDFLNDGKTLQIIYTVKDTRTEGDALAFSLGSGTDIQIGGDDDAIITNIMNDGAATGFMMKSAYDFNDNGEPAQFNFFGKGYKGVTDVSDFWYGAYSTSYHNTYYWSGNQKNAIFYSNENSLSGKDYVSGDLDSAATWHWDGSIEPGETKTYSVLIGIGGAGSENAANGGGLTSPTGPVKLDVTGTVESISITKADGTTLDPSLYSYTVQNGTLTITFDEAAGLGFNTGNLTVTVTFAGAESESAEVTIENKITLTAEQKVAAVKKAIEEAIEKMTATNDTTQESVEEIVNTALNSVEGITDVTATVAPISKTDATTAAAGSVISMVTISCDDVEATVGINKIIAKLPAPSSSSSSSTVKVPVSNDNNSVDVKASVSGKDATIKPLNDDQIEEILSDEEAAGNVVIDLSDLGKKIDTAGIPKESLEAILEAAEDHGNDTEHLVIKLSTAELILDDAAMRAIVDQAEGSIIKFNFDDVGLSRLNKEQKEAIQDMDVRKGYEAYITVNGKRISDFEGGKVEIIIPYAVPAGELIAGFSVWYIDEDGELEKQKSTYDGKEKCFVVSHFSDYVITYSEQDALAGSYAACLKDADCPVELYADADPAYWYHNGVHFCIEKNLMQGVDGTYFAPYGTTTRAQLVTILWRLENMPQVDDGEDFNDVYEGDWYYNAIRWASANNIVGGYDDGNFGPKDSITREQTVAILWRYAKYKGYDVSVGEDTNILSYGDAFDIAHYAIPAMQWACGAGVMEGISDSNGLMNLQPQGSTTRAQMATMIMRFCVEIEK